MTEPSVSSVIDIVHKAAKPLYNLIKVTGPFLIAQSKTAVENYSDFKLNKARLEAISSLLKEEVKNISADRSMIREKTINSSGLERIRAQEDYNLLTKEINKLSTIDKVKDFINNDNDIENDIEIGDGWIEKFNELASSLNEEWRKQLLAKAFSLELQKTNSINILTLNSIASFDEKTFRLFGFIVNSSIRLYEINFLPQIDYDREFVINGQAMKMSAIIYNLKHLNLVTFDEDSFINMQDKDIYIRYGRRVLQIKYPKPCIPPAFHIKMNSFTPLGNSIANLYTRNLNSFGNENFNTLLQEAKNKHYIFSEIEMSQQLHDELGN
ncbi:DUF2806 domain-containing protein [Klebsiella pneumoniae]|uniref:DUF2806 domain-containing protein n=1 Tax=Klebsiella pneumoniae TaxID=573 RepID=UPI000C75C039|nr:DUF2806 domain-containing protein [Klebsiella pneumoniae]MCD5758964.1 DUF2806 domain-containing protein [Klebsiella pneumoniae]UGM84591.1 DUF2806 domain-containing protein [Klebsiella pneumoniae]